MTVNEKILAEVREELSRLPVIDSNDIPNINLYMDQVTTFMEEHLAAYRRTSDEKILTKTMINNYAKNKLLPPPEKKKYTREHILVLVFIYYFKGILSLQDIQSILSPITEKYFQGSNEIDVQKIYDEIFSHSKEWGKVIETNVLAYEKMAFSSFPDAEEEDQDFVQMFSLICSLCFDIYVKKKVIEKLLDKTADQRK